MRCLLLLSPKVLPNMRCLLVLSPKVLSPKVLRNMRCLLVLSPKVLSPKVLRDMKLPCCLLVLSPKVLRDMKLPLTFLAFLLTLSPKMMGQDFEVKWMGNDAEVNVLALEKIEEQTFESVQNANEQLSFWNQQLQNNGYAESGIDSIRKTEKLWKVYWHIGPQYNWIALNADEIEEGILSQIGFRDKLYQGKPFNFRQLRSLQESLLVYAENNGYPFAKVGLKNIEIESGSVKAEIDFQKNQMILIDSIVIQGDAKISNRFLQNYLDIKPGDPYSESKLQKTALRSKELPFIQEIRSPNVLIREEEAQVDLFFKKVQASQFDFLLGILPNTGADNGYSISGEGKINLLNSLGAGEEFLVEYKSYPQKATELKLKVVYPYLPYIPIGLDVKFDLYLRDSLYRNINTYLGLIYNLRGANYVQLFYENYSTALTSINENQIIQSKSLPKDLDVNNNYYGLALNYEKLDYRFNPRKGWRTNISLGIGIKKIPKNIAILDLKDPNQEDYDFRQLYDEIPEQSVQVKSSYQFEKYWKLFQRSTIKTGLRGALIRIVDGLNQNNIYDNERFRIGGNQLLRYDGENLQNGIYFFHIYVGEQLITKKVTVAR